MILTVTLSPAVDKTCRTGELFCGRVNRMRSVTNIAGGKGINVSRILKQYGYDVTATGFLGGYPGQWVETRLRKAGIRTAFVETDGETRCSMNIVADNGFVTEILEPGPHISQMELKQFLERFDALVSECRMVVLSGSVAPGIPEDIYARLIREAKAAGREAILDSSGELLRRGIGAGPAIIKPNRKELEYLIGHRLRDREDLKEAAGVLRKNGVGLVVVSLGDRGLMLAGKSGFLYAGTPKVKALNTVGCGDSVVASLVMQRLAGADEEEMIRHAAALSAAGATTLENGDIPRHLAGELYRDIRVEKL